MLMKIIAQILKGRGITAYRLAREMNLPVTQITGWLKSEEQASFRLPYLCQLRELSGLSWEQFGELLDREFGAKK